MNIKALIYKLLTQTSVVTKPSIAICAERLLMPSIFTRTQSQKLRALLFLPESPHSTQLNQDLFALFLNKYQPGYFVEIGANDGYTLSNTIYLEEEFGWKGLLIEANPKYEESLKRRKCSVAISAVTSEPGEYEFCDAGLYGGVENTLDTTHKNRTLTATRIKVSGARLEDLLSSNGAPSRINFISIDVEGGELQIVKQLTDQSNYRFTCGCIEHNYREADYKQIYKMLTDAGYAIAWDGQTRHDLFFYDPKILS